MYITDTGKSVQSVSAAEFLSELDTHIIPKMIESKGDILYAANVKDGMSETMELFTTFDARSYSTGNMYNGQSMFTKTGDAYTPALSFEDLDQEHLTHKQFTGHGIAQWNKEYWDKISTDTSEFHMDSMTFSRELIADNIKNNTKVWLQITNPNEAEIQDINAEIDALELQMSSLKSLYDSSSSDPCQSWPGSPR